MYQLLAASVFVATLLILGGILGFSLRPALEKPTSPPLDGQVKQPVTSHATVRVIVIPVPGDNVTASCVISDGLVRFSRSMKTMNNLSIANGTERLTDTMADVVINFVNIMATVQDKDKPNKIFPHHVYATRTAIASFLTLRTLVVKHLQRPIYIEANAITVLDDTFSACIYLGLAILTARAPYSAHLASSIGLEVKRTSSQTFSLSPEGASILAEDMVRIYTKTIATKRSKPPPPKEIRPLLSIFTSDQLAALAREMAYRLEVLDIHHPEKAAAEITAILLDFRVEVRARFCPCTEESKKFPICLCGFDTESEEYFAEFSSRKLLPGI